MTNIGRVCCLIPDLSQTPPELHILTPTSAPYSANSIKLDMSFIFTQKNCLPSAQGEGCGKKHQTSLSIFMRLKNHFCHSCSHPYVCIPITCLVANLCLTVTPLTAAHQASVLHYLPVCLNSCPSSQWCCLTISATPFSFCQHQGFFQWVSSSHQVAKVLELQL